MQIWPFPAPEGEVASSVGFVATQEVPVPAFVAKLAFGQMAEEVLLAGQRVEPTKLIASGYPFHYSDLRKALEAVLKP